MLVANALITKEFWEPFHNYILRQFRRGEYERLGRSLVYRMNWRGRRLYVLARMEIANQVEVMGWLYLGRQKDWAAWEILQSFIFEVHRGSGWGRYLYSTPVKLDGILLSSGNRQTKAGRAIWKSLVKRDRLNIWAHDFKDLKRRAPVVYDPENDDIWSELQIYDTHWTYASSRRDVRLIAMRK